MSLEEQTATFSSRYALHASYYRFSANSMEQGSNREANSYSVESLPLASIHRQINVLKTLISYSLDYIPYFEKIREGL